MGCLIGIAGAAGAGKDTLADYIIRESPDTFHRASYAAPLRIISKKLYLDPYLRATKEKETSVFFEDLHDSVISAIDDELQSCVSDEDRAALFSYLIEELDAGGHTRYTDEGDVLTISPRAFMQILGTEAGRRVNPDFWIKILLRHVMAIPSPVIVTDVRFPNEVDTLAFLIYKNGSGLKGSHASEQHQQELRLSSDVTVPYYDRVHQLKSTAKEIVSILEYRGII